LINWSDFSGSSYEYKLQVLTLALLMVGDHHKVNLLFGIWFKPDLWAFVSFFHFMDSSKPLAFSLERADKQFHKMSLISADCYVPHITGNTHTGSREDCFMQINSHGFAC